MSRCCPSQMVRGSLCVATRPPALSTSAVPCCGGKKRLRSKPLLARDPRRVERGRIKTQAVMLGEAEVVAVGATAFAASAVGTCLWVVSTRVNRTIRTRNLRTAVCEKLQAAQLRLLEGTDNDQEQEGLRREVAKLKVLQAQMEEDAQEGRAIQGRAQVPELTPLLYLQKSLTSTLRDAKGSREDTALGGLSNYVSAVNLLIIFFLLLTIAFLP